MNPDIFQTAKFMFLCESAFRPHETSESAHRNGIFLKPLSRVDFFESVEFVDSSGQPKPDIF